MPLHPMHGSLVESLAGQGEIHREPDAELYKSTRAALCGGSNAHTRNVLERAIDSSHTSPSHRASRQAQCRPIHKYLNPDADRKGVQPATAVEKLLKQ